MNQILLVADRQTTIDSLRALIDKKEYGFLVASNQRAAVRMARRDAPDLVIMDNTSARLSGTKLSRALQRVLDAPLIAIVREASEADEIAATECLVKPYTGRQLFDCLARAMAYPRRLIVGQLQLDLRTRKVDAPHLQEAQVLTPKLFSLLRLLMSSEGRTVTRERLMREVWQTNFMDDTRTLDVHVRWARMIIEPQPGQPQYLHTVRGVGYMMDPPPVPHV